MEHLTGEGLAAIIVAVATFITSLGSMIISLRNSGKITKVHDLTNSKMEQLLTVTETSAEARGKLAADTERRIKRMKARNKKRASDAEK